MSVTKRAYKYRFFSTDEQSNVLARTFGGVRYLYNWSLHTRSTACKERGEKLLYSYLAALLPDLKQEHLWLKEVASVPVQQSFFYAFLYLSNQMLDYCPDFLKNVQQVCCLLEDTGGNDPTKGRDFYEEEIH